MSEKKRITWKEKSTQSSNLKEACIDPPPSHIWAQSGGAFLVNREKRRGTGTTGDGSLMTPTQSRLAETKRGGRGEWGRGRNGGKWSPFADYHNKGVKD